MSKSLLEKDYYPIVEKWLKKQHKCFKTAINTGPINSRADVIGIRDTGGDFSGEIETIIVEVKRNRQPFATASGQAYGYSIYANRVYLADVRPNGFTQDEIMIANHVGIGLIQIDGRNNCKEVLSSPYFKPLAKFSVQLLHKLGLVKCQFCDTYFSLSDDGRWNSNVTRENVSKAIEEDRGLLFWHRELNERKNKYKSEKRSKGLTYERRYLCPECTYMLFSGKIE